MLETCGGWWNDKSDAVKSGESSGSADGGPGWHDCSGGAPARAWRYRVCGRLGEYAGSGMSCPSGIPSVALRTSRDISAGIDITVSRSYGSGAVILSLQHRSFFGLYLRHPRLFSWHRDSSRTSYTDQIDKKRKIKNKREDGVLLNNILFCFKQGITHTKRLYNFVFTIIFWSIFVSEEGLA